MHVCARECPDWCIYIESHKEPVPGHEYRGRIPLTPRRDAAGSGERPRPVRDRFLAVHVLRDLYQACPYDALFWSPEFSYAETDIVALTHEQGRSASGCGLCRRRPPR